MANLKKFDTTLDSLDSEAKGLAKSVGALKEIPNLILEIKSLHKDVAAVDAQFRRSTGEQSDMIVELKSSVTRIEASADGAIREIQLAEKRIEADLKSQDKFFTQALDDMKNTYIDRTDILVDQLNTAHSKMNKLRLMFFIQVLSVLAVVSALFYT